MTAKKILFIDDDPELVKMIELRFKSTGYKVFTAGDGKGGLDVAKREAPDLIIVDVVMPGLDGLGFVRELKRQFPMNRVPIIVVSGREKTKELFAAEGVFEFLTKPFKAEDLLAKVNKLLPAS